LLYIIALVDCAESGRWSFVSLVSAILVALGDWSLAILVALGDWSLAGLIHRGNNANGM
jgi:hypothetical protein